MSEFGTMRAQAAPGPTTRSAEVVVESVQGVSDPATTETVTASKSDEFITITRTTTTTTTVTEVIRTPRALLPSWAVDLLSQELTTER